MAAHNFVEPDKPAFILLSSDFRAEGTNFVFGVTRKSQGLSLQSVWGFEQAITEITLLLTVIRHIARHEFGHLMGLESETIRNQVTRGGLYERHCMNECTMQQVINVDEAAHKAQQLAGKVHSGFCNDCAEVLSLHR